MALVRFDPIIFTAGTGLSAADLNSLTLNARLIDALSYRGRRAFTNTTIRHQWENDRSPTPLISGAFQYRSGVTNLNIIAEAVFPGGGTHTLQVYLNGTLRYSTTFLTTRTQYFFNITGYGFTDLDVVEVEIYDSWTGADGECAVLDAYIDAMSGVTGFGSYSIPPSFGAISQSNLAALMAAQQWCYDRLNVTDQLAFTGPFFIAGLAYTTSYEVTIFDGGICKSNGADRLRINLNYYIIANQAESVKVRINGTQVAIANFTVGQWGEYGFDIDISSYTTDILFRLTIVQSVTTPPVSTARQLGSRFALKDIYTTRASYTVPSLPSVYNPLDTLSFTTLQTALNQIRQATIDSVNRIGSATDVFNRQRLFRWRPAVDAEQRTYYKDVIAVRGRRAHDAFWVRGKGLKIGYGPVTFTKNAPDQLYEWETQYTEELLGGDTVQTKLFYFDQFPALDLGMDYYIIGDDCRYVAEQVR